MAYDTSTSQIVLFGGVGSSSALGDTWEFDGTSWTQLNPVHSPSPRWNVSMAYDPAIQAIVLFGGYNDGTAFGDTWEWNGSDWIQQDPANSPNPRYGDMIAYNDSLDSVVMYGGQESPNADSLLSDTWKWDGRDWSQITSSATPGSRSFAAMNQDEGVLFGDDGGSVQVNDCSSVTTWQFTEVGWSELATTAPPPGRSYPVMAHDPADNTTVMFGGTGCNSNFLNDTWLFTGPKTSLPTATAIKTSMDRVPVAKNITLTAVVKPAPDGGTVTFYDGENVITACASIAPSNTGRAKCKVSFRSPGTYSITASYSGDSGYQASTSPALSINVNQARTTTKLTSSANPTTEGKAVTYKAKVAPVPDGGTVAFADGGNPMPACDTVPVSTSTGVVSCKVAYPSLGTHVITVSYSGDDSYAPSESPSLIEIVSPR